MLLRICSDQAFIYGDQNILLMFGFSQKKKKKSESILHLAEKTVILCVAQLPCLVYAMCCGKNMQVVNEYHVWITPRPKCIIRTEHSAAATIHLFTIQSKHLPTVKSTWQRVNAPNI